MGLTAQRTANSTGQATAHTAEAPAIRREVERGRRSCDRSFRFGTVHRSSGLPSLHACAHRHHMWFLFCFVCQLACDLILWRRLRPDGRSSGLSVRHRVGGFTAGAFFSPSPSDTYFSGSSIINTPGFAR